MSDHWLLNPGAWYRLQLGNHNMPGVWNIEYDANFIVDLAKAKKKDGANLIDLGREAVQMTMTGRMVSPEDWDKLKDIIPEFASIRPATGAAKGQRIAYDVVHPAAQLIGIKKVRILLIAAPRIQGGILTQVIRAVEVGKPVKVPDKPKNVRTSADVAKDDRDELLGPNSTNKGPDYLGYNPGLPWSG